MDARGEISILGEVRANLVNGDSIKLSSKRSRELLSALTLASGRCVRREKLCNDLWPDLSSTRGRKALNTELWRLKTAIRDAGGEASKWIQSTQSDIRICTENGLQTDFDQFNIIIKKQQSFNRDELIYASNLYKGELADGIQAEWLEPLREEIRIQYYQLLELCIAELTRQELYSQAYIYSKRLIKEDPYNEFGHRELLKIQFSNGDKSSALHYYHEYCNWLMKELGISPSDETIKLVESQLDRSDSKARITLNVCPYSKATIMHERLNKMRDLANELLNVADEVEKDLELSQ